MKRILIMLCLVAAVSSCGVANRTADYAYKGKITVGICKSGSSKETLKYFKKCVRNAGAKPYFFEDYATTDEMAKEYLSKVDALIVPGKSGGDTTGRNKYDKKVIAAALDQGKPILGICLGHQEIGSFYGGSTGSVKKNYPESNLIHRNKVGDENIGLRTEAHAINIEKDSRLYKVLGQERIMVNTSHNYSVIKVGEGLRVVATADDGVVEAIEDNSRNVMGVQFHPEYLYGFLHLKQFLPIFKNLVDEARAVRSADMGVK